MGMKRVASWLAPTLIAPMIGAALYVFLVSRGSDLPIPAFAWVLAGALASGVSFIVGSMMAVTDVALLKLKLREPPSGWRAWAMGLIAPAPVLFAWQKLLTFPIGMTRLLLTFFLPMLVVALVMRITLGTRPGTWKD